MKALLSLMTCDGTAFFGTAWRRTRMADHTEISKEEILGLVTGHSRVLQMQRINKLPGTSTLW